ncbi:MAG: universal stress protein [Chlorobiaceae bacterium]
MIQLSKILCPTDYSAASDKAVRYAVEFARKVGAHVRFIHILSSASAAAQEEDDVIPESFSGVLMAEKKKGLDADIRVLKGAPAVVIAEQAATWGADLIIMGSHGRTGLKRLMMGSVAEEVFRSSDIPVLLVKRSARD